MHFYWKHQFTWQVSGPCYNSQFNSNKPFQSSITSLKSPFSTIRYFQQQDSNWEASSRQNCYAAGQSSAECGSEKDSLLRIVLRKLSPQEFSACKFPLVCKSGYTVHPVIYWANPSRTHGIFFLFIQFAIIHNVDQEYLAHTADKRKMLAIRLALWMKHFFQMIMIRTKIIP